LIDAVGTLDDAIAEAAKQASLADWRAVTLEKPITLLTAITERSKRRLAPYRMPT